jgi:hypothetical protein
MSAPTRSRKPWIPLLIAIALVIAAAWMLL